MPATESGAEPRLRTPRGLNIARAHRHAGGGQCDVAGQRQDAAADGRCAGVGKVAVGNRQAPLPVFVKDPGPVSECVQATGADPLSLNVTFAPPAIVMFVGRVRRCLAGCRR